MQFNLNDTLVLYRGYATTRTIYIQNAAGAPENLTGKTLSFTIAVIDRDGNLGARKLQKSCTITNPTGGVATVAIAAADFTTIAAGTYAYEFTIIDSSSNPKPAGIGPCAINERPYTQAP